VPRSQLRRIWFSLQCLNAHPLYQHGDVEPADLEAFLDEQALQHLAAGEGEVRVKLVDPMHQLQVGNQH
jgi:hypothetical protein